MLMYHNIQAMTWLMLPVLGLIYSERKQKKKWGQKVYRFIRESRSMTKAGYGSGKNKLTLFSTTTRNMSSEELDTLDTPACINVKKFERRF